jgi:hypothetical protein
MASQSIERVRRVIQDKNTRLYYAGAGEWVKVLENAKAFGSITDASLAMAQAGMRDSCEIVIRFEGKPEYDLHLPA